MALKGKATQSSTLSYANAAKAIDGRRNSFYSAGSCSHTAEDETEPWWRVDLGEIYTVISVKITNRGDCCADRLDGAEIRIGSSLENNGNSNPRYQQDSVSSMYCNFRNIRPLITTAFWCHWVTERVCPV